MIFHTTFEQGALSEKTLYDFSYNIQVRVIFEKDLYDFSYTFKPKRLLETDGSKSKSNRTVPLVKGASVEKSS
ncbi:hypothetical protein J19TS2_60760 [Cohnella xylanilytica]|nr:hypothetical protein J19TS2_60760 [Cohnella xylanilytica]